MPGLAEIVSEPIRRPGEWDAETQDKRKPFHLIPSGIILPLTGRSLLIRSYPTNRPSLTSYLKLHFSSLPDINFILIIINFTYLGYYLSTPTKMRALLKAWISCFLCSLLFSCHLWQCLTSESSSIFVELAMNHDIEGEHEELREEFWLVLTDSFVCLAADLKKKNQTLALLAILISEMLLLREMCISS